MMYLHRYHKKLQDNNKTLKKIESINIFISLFYNVILNSCLLIIDINLEFLFCTIQSYGIDIQICNITIIFQRMIKYLNYKYSLV